MSWRAALALAVVLLVGACAADDDSAESAATTTSSPAADSQDADNSESNESDAPRSLSAAIADCPGDYAGERVPSEGLNDGFTSAGQDRAFHLLLPDESFDGPRPLFVALTGTVQSEPGFLEQSGLDMLPDDGWIVVAPARNSNGLLWGPWDAMRSAEQRPLPNPDVEFFDDAIACVGAHHDVDADRIFVGGISIGGTMVTHLLRVRSELYAGGIVGSGNFATTEPAEPEPLDDMVVIVAWGGEDDEWSGCMDGRMGREAGESGEPGCIPSISFVADASTASQFFAEEPAVHQVACSMDVGHRWITEATPYFAELLVAHPKGSRSVTLPGDPPDGLECSTDPFITERP